MRWPRSDSSRGLAAQRGDGNTTAARAFFANRYTPVGNAAFRWAPPTTTLACTATSDGGTASESVTIYRDAAPPAITCLPSPSSLWPPTGRLVPVTVGINVTDETSGPDGFLLIGAATTVGDLAQDVLGFDVGTPDVAGLLRAKRPGTVSERIYSLAYTARDLAGNITPVRGRRRRPARPQRLTGGARNRRARIGAAIPSSRISGW